MGITKETWTSCPLSLGVWSLSGGRGIRGIGRSDSLFASPGPVERLHAEILKLGMCATSLSSGGDNPDLLLFFLVNATPGEDDESLK